MRPLHLAILVAVPFLHGCAKTCTTEGLQASLAALPDSSADATAKALAAACPADRELAAWLAAPDGPPNQSVWQTACPGVTDPAKLDARPLIYNRKQAFEACDLDSANLGTSDSFAMSGGRTALAIATTKALLADDKVDAATAAQIGKQLLGPPMLALPPVELARVAMAPTGDVGPASIVVTAKGVTQDGQPRAWRDIVPSDGPILAVAPEVSSATLLRAVQAASAPGTPAKVWVMATADGQDDRPTLLALGSKAPDDAVSISYAADGSKTLSTGTMEQLLTSASAVSLPSKPGQTAGEYLILAGSFKGGASIDTTLGLCDDPPVGMVCVPGGAIDNVVTVSTFYADATEASVGDYKLCVDARACPDVPTRAAADHPMTGLSFLDARMYCSFSGKRLPTKWEFQRLATDPAAPDKLTCDVANHGGCTGAARAVGEGTANLWGAFNVLGNASEATSTYPNKSTEKCGAACQGLDPLGPCDGAPMCKGRLSRIFRGGSAGESANYAVPIGEKVVNKKRRLAGQGVRCVSDDSVLESLPSAWLQDTPAAPAAPAALDDAGRAIMAAIAQDNIDEIPECDDGRRGSSQTDCKDPTHYIYPNEDRAPITYPYIKNRGGALLGVGSDQNYTFAAVAKSELVFLLDYDAIVVHIHRVNQAFIKHADTPDGFVAMWDPKNRASSLEVIAKEWQGDPMMPTYQRTLRSLNNIMFGHYKRTRAPSPSGATSWLRDPTAYTWVRDLWLGGRIVSLKGDMLGPKAMMGVGDALKKLNVPMRVYYTSNAPNAWGGMMTPEYKRNVRNFPMDERSVVLQALGWVNEFGQTGHWHFNVQDGPQVQERLGNDGYTLLWQVVRPYRNTNDIDLSLSGIRGTWADAHPE